MKPSVASFDTPSGADDRAKKRLQVDQDAAGSSGRDFRCRPDRAAITEAILARLVVEGDEDRHEECHQERPQGQERHSQ